jgi:hemoglobin
MTTENPIFGDEDTSYQAAGGIEGIQQLVNEFYDLMDSLPESEKIRSLHKKDLSDARKKLSYFLSGWLGGPKLYQEHIGSISIPGFHRKFNIGSAERDA